MSQTTVPWQSVLKFALLFLRLVSSSTVLVACRGALPDTLVEERHLAAAEQLAHAWPLPVTYTMFPKKKEMENDETGEEEEEEGGRRG